MRVLSLLIGVGTLLSVNVFAESRCQMLNFWWHKTPHYVKYKQKSCESFTFTYAYEATYKDFEVEIPTDGSWVTTDYFGKSRFYYRDGFLCRDSEGTSGIQTTYYQLVTGLKSLCGESVAPTEFYWVASQFPVGHANHLLSCRARAVSG